ncbi:MAG: sulfatase [Verrucomicrobiota bacterium]
MKTRIILLLTLLATPPLSGEDKRPNILFAFADDWGRHASIYAEVDSADQLSAFVETPNFDRIAEEGVLFPHAFVSAPSCTPCRSALLSGQHFWRTGRAAILQGAVWDETIPTYPLLLRDSGYHIGKTYKVWSPGTVKDAPYGANAYDYGKGGGRPNGFSQNMTKLVGSGKSIEDAKNEILNEVRENFRQFLADQEEGKPFCYWYGATNVHRKWIRGSGKVLWGIDPDQLKDKMPPFLPDVPVIREDFADYLGEAHAFDASLGVLLEELEKSGQYENTIIAVSGDHGPAGFPHGKCNLYDFGSNVALAISGPGVEGGRVAKDLVSLPDLAPTFLDAGKTEVPEVMTGRSLWPTLSSTGEGIVDESRTEVFIGRERHVGDARADYIPYPQRAIRTHDYLFITNFKPDRWPLGDPYLLDSDEPPTKEELTETTFITLPDEDAGPTKAWLVLNRENPKWKPYFDHAYGKRPKEQLFDLKKDPYQMENVAEDPAYADIAKDLRTRLFTELESTGDPRLINDGEFFETPPMAREKPPEVKRRNVRR